MQELRAATLRQEVQAVVRTVRQIGDHALAAADARVATTLSSFLQPAYPPKDSLPPAPMYLPDALFPSAAWASGLINAVAAAAAVKPPWPQDVQLSILSVWAALVQCPETATYTLSSHHAVFLIDRLQTELTAALSAPSLSPGATPEPGVEPPPAAAAQPPTVLLEGYLSLAVFLFSHKLPSPELHSRRCDLVAYALACGIVYRLAELISLLDRVTCAAASVPPCVQLCLLLLQVLTTGHTPLVEALHAPGMPERHTLRCKVQVCFLDVPAVLCSHPCGICSPGF
jgi:hypothetical protein